MRVLARVDELTAVDSFVSGLGRSDRRLLLLTGEVGIGRTTVWEEALDRAGRRGCLVLPARPTESESGYRFSGLSDLFEPVAAVMLAALPQPQRRAVEFAMLRSDPEAGESVETRSVAAGVLGGLRALATERPVLLAVDDLHWLDESTLAVLSFVLRRIRPQPVGLIATVRTDPGRVPPAAGLTIGGPETTATVLLGPLDRGAIRELVLGRLDAPPDQVPLSRLHHASGGNPFIALELAAAIDPHAEPGGELQVPPSLRRYVQQSIGGLDESTRRLLLLAALAPDAPSTAVLIAAGDAAAARDDLETAIEAQLLEIQSGRIGFRRPLVRSVVLADATARARRAGHRRLADATALPIERARHLALAVSGPDPELATVLDTSAREAGDGAQPEVAAELGELALALTPAIEVDDRRRRTEAAAAYRFDAGEAGRARQLTEQLIADTPPGQPRAGLLARLATYQRYSGADVETWNATLTAALAEAGDDVDLRLRAHFDLGMAAVNGGDAAAIVGHLAAMRALVDDCRDPLLRSQALAGVVWVDFLFGNGIDLDLAHRAMDGYESGASLPIEVRPSYSIATTAALAGELDLARTLLDREYVDALRSGSDAALPLLLWALVFVETWAGNWTRARQFADQGGRVADSSGMGLGVALIAGARSILRAGQGDAENAVRDAETAREMNAALGIDQPVDFPTEALGALAISRGDAAAAHAVLGPCAQRVLEVGVTDPGLARFFPDEIEALVRLGDIDAAELLLAPFARQAQRLERPWALAATARCQGLIAIARGDLPAAVAAADVAVATSENLGMPLDRGRALLVAGEIHRRARRKRKAHDCLTEAKAVFDAQGALLWAARCRDELARIGLRARAPVVGGLTRAEQRVAELAADGYTTKLIAATLFTGTRTVEAHLQRAYRKLSVHSRLELARRLAELDADGGEA